VVFFQLRRKLLNFWLSVYRVCAQILPSPYSIDLIGRVHLITCEFCSPCYVKEMDFLYNVYILIFFSATTPTFRVR